MAAKSFSIGAILTIAGECLLCDIDEVYEILNFMTGDNLFTHQIPRACRECAPHILRQHPQLSEFNGDGIDSDNWREKLKEAEIRFGETLEINPIPMDDHTKKDPLQELSEMVGPEKIIVVNPED